jgi:hypothetical protein
MGKKYGSGLNIPFPDHFLRELRNIFWILNTKFFDADPDPGWENSDPGPGINLPDLQHWNLEHW